MLFVTIILFVVVFLFVAIFLAAVLFIVIVVVIVIDEASWGFCKFIAARGAIGII